MEDSKNPIVDRTGKTYPPELLVRPEIERLLEQFSTRAPTGMRNRALITLLWRSGLRHDEVLSLRVRDVDTVHNTIRVRHGKGNKARTVGLDALGNGEVSRWVTARARFDLPKDAPLFCSISKGAAGKKLAQTYIRRTIRQKSQKAGLEKRITPHTLRHACATGMEGEGLHLKVIQATLGHGNVATTDVYLSTLTGGEATKAVQERV